MHYPFTSSRITRPVRSRVTVTAFEYNSTWLGVSDLLASFSLQGGRRVSFKLPVDAPNDSFVLAVAWEEDGIYRRYKFWDGGVLHYPLYNGESIPSGGLIEVWSTTIPTAGIDADFPLETSWLSEPAECAQSPVIPGGSGTSYTTVLDIWTPPTTGIISTAVWLAVQGVSALRGITGYENNQIQYLEYLTAANDGMGGHFVFDVNMTTADDGIDVVKPNDIDSAAPGRWKRQNNIP
jgi:hypothetical protein